MHLRLTADDLLADLTWPKLFRAPALALRPRRLLLCVVAAWLIGWLDRASTVLAGDDGSPLLELMFGVGWLDAALAFRSGLWWTAPGDVAVDAVGGPFSTVFVEAPMRALLMVPLLVTLAVVAWAVTARIAAIDFARGRPVGLFEAARAVARRWRPLTVAIVAPLATLGIFWLVLAVGGWLLLSFPVVNTVGAVLAPLAWLLALAMVVVAACTVFGGPMLVPAVVCEDEDGVEAVQRAFAYVTQRPLRLMIYLGLLTLIGVALLGVTAALVGLATESFVNTTGAWGGERARAVLTPNGDDLGGTDAFAAWLIGLTTNQTGAIVAGVGLSYFASASTLLYLAMRRVVDGQDTSDLPLEGEVAARIDATMAGYAAERPEPEAQAEAETDAQAENDAPVEACGDQPASEPSSSEPAPPNAGASSGDG
ncbi:MAG: hypothetical protein AAF108_02555 [Planctomycetota bacterium]